MAPVAIHLRKHIDPATHYTPIWPDGLVLSRFEPQRHARAARALLNDAYAGGGGDVLAFETWWPALTADPEYRPELCFVAIDSATGALAGFAQCWSLGFVKDIAVAVPWRGRGLGRAMMTEIFRSFQLLGVTELDLKVAADNPSQALGFYQRLGMVRPG
ncbi:GNAT family N-acetyltransferase [Maricaulis sp.]|uniref:GNAT family N-acetyltransferase n=1 Tax=Maricaulis sp. TaxID=1486257 RepID=UPI003A91818D